MLTSVTLITDGACLGNPGPGGYAAILQAGAAEKVVAGSENQTTNNRMELSAVIAGLSALKRRCQVTLLTDSHYVITMLNGGKAKANQDLVARIRELAKNHEITATYVAGHTGHPLNERANKLARAEAQTAKQARAAEPMPK